MPSDRGKLSLQLTTCYDEDDYMDIESANSDCQSSNFES